MGSALHEHAGQRSLLMITHDDLPDGVVDAQYRLRDGVLARESTHGVDLL